MSANVETMFFIGRNVPWHGLGTSVPDAPSSADALIAGGLNWKVDKEPIFKENGVPIPGYFANVRDSDKSVLGVVSSRYTIVQNDEAFRFTDNLLDSGVKYETCGALKGGRVVWLLARMPEEKILDDEFVPYICFTNTHDGTGSVRVCLTPTRVVCMNTLNLALDNAKRSWATVHRGDISSRLAEAQHTLGLINDYTYQLKVEAEKLASIKVSDSAFEAILDNIYPIEDGMSDVRKRRIDFMKQEVFNCLGAADLSNYRGTAYGIINAVADFADHSTPLRATSTSKENRWAQIMVGHPLVDKVYSMVKVA